MSRPKYSLDVHYAHELEEEHIPIRGNAMASGDAELDRQVEDEIIADLNAGKLEAWCCAHVRAFLTFSGTERAFVSDGDAYRGACSYRTENELWESMTLDYDLDGEARALAVADLRKLISSVAERNAFNKLAKKLEHDETLARVLASIARVNKMYATDPKWAAGELVRLDQALEKL